MPSPPPSHSHSPLPCFRILQLPRQLRDWSRLMDSMKATAMSAAMRLEMEMERHWQEPSGLLADLAMQWSSMDLERW